VKLTLTIETNNSAFTDEEEGPTAFLLADAIESDVEDAIRNGATSGRVTDPNNGATVGTWELVPGVTE
jgi:hypothetical protein